MQVRQLNILRLRGVTVNHAAFSHVAKWEQAWGYGEVFREEGLAIFILPTDWWTQRPPEWSHRSNHP